MRAAALLTVLCGCSFGARGPDTHSTPPVPCTDSYGLVELDGGAAAVLSALVIGLGTRREQRTTDPPSEAPPQTSNLLLLIPIAIVYGTAIAWGVDHVHACRASRSTTISP
jgi:hypothetical protein